MTTLPVANSPLAASAKTPVDRFDAAPEPTFMADEPLIVPVSTGAVLVRLSMAAGALKRHLEVARLLPSDILTHLQHARDSLLRALEEEDHAAVYRSFRAGQTQLHRLYETLLQLGSQGARDDGDNGVADNGEAAATAVPDADALCAALGFPAPRPGLLEPVDTQTVVATYSRPQRQILTTLAFRDAVGAHAYWLHEIRMLRGERVEDALVESTAPLFTRLRLPSGPHTFRIESRKASRSVFTGDFSIEVPSA